MTRFSMLFGFAMLLAFLPLAVCRADTVFDAGQAAFKKGDYTEAFRLWHPLAEDGFAEAQLRIGRLYISGKGTEKDVLFGVSWLMQAASQGLASAQLALGGVYLIDDDEKDFGKAAYWLRRAAEQKDAKAEYYLARLYEFGRGVKRSTDEAHRLYRRSARSGFVRAQYELGIKLSFRGGEIAEAIRWLKTASETGHVGARTRLAQIYSMQHETQIGCCTYSDPVAGARLYHELADEGIPNAQERLGWYYSKGPRNSRDIVKAYKWYRLAYREFRRICLTKAKDIVSDLSLSQRCQNRARISAPWRMKFKNQQLHRDYESINRSLTIADIRLQELRQKMSAEQILDANKRIAEWLAQPGKRIARNPIPSVFTKF